MMKHCIITVIQPSDNTKHFCHGYLLSICTVKSRDTTVSLVPRFRMVPWFRNITVILSWWAVENTVQHRAPLAHYSNSVKETIQTTKITYHVQCFLFCLPLPKADKRGKLQKREFDKVNMWRRSKLSNQIALIESFCKKWTLLRKNVKNMLFNMGL